jgi:hypothetical protein
MDSEIKVEDILEEVEGTRRPTNPPYKKGWLAEFRTQKFTYIEINGLFLKVLSTWYRTETKFIPE